MGKVWEVLGNCGKFREVLGSLGKVWEGLGSLGSFGKFRKVFSKTSNQLTIANVFNGGEEVQITDDAKGQAHVDQ